MSWRLEQGMNQPGDWIRNASWMASLQWAGKAEGGSQYQHGVAVTGGLHDPPSRLQDQG
ncbi:MAG: hypothetical protein VYA84_05850 [Planctomycetota bacterium]|nr:hypothetical protein [Planctomycetota bacterium]